MITKNILDNAESFIVGHLTNGDLSKEVNYNWSNTGEARCKFGRGGNSCNVSLENFKENAAWKT